MSQLSADVGPAAPPHAISLGGERYEFRHLDGPALAGYQRRRFEEERDRLRLLREDYPPEEYVRRLDELRARFERGEFDLLADVERLGLAEGAPPDLEAMTAGARRELPELVLRVLGLMTGRSDRENWRLFMAAPEEVGRLMQLVIAESFRPAGRPEGAAPATTS